MTRAELEAAFAPVEDISACDAHLVGGDKPMPPQVPGADKKPHAYCARSIDIGGLTFGEVGAVAKTYAQVSSGDAVDVQEGVLSTFAQVRGSLRARALAEASLLEADRGRSGTAYAAVSSVVDQVLLGGITFARAHSSRREICALIADSCDDMDPDRVRTYTQGGYTLAQLDADAHSRVVYGKCRTPFLQHQETLATRLVRRTGALAGIGLARAARPDHQLDPSAPSTFSTYSSRSGLEPGLAKFGVEVANAVPAAEVYWRGAVALAPAADAKSDWLTAVAWLRDGHVTRVLLNVSDETKLGDLPSTLASVFGSPGTTKTTVTTWSLSGGHSAILDIGAATSLVVESVGATGTSTVAALPSGSGPMASAAAVAFAGLPPATAEMAACCSALEQALMTADPSQRSGYSALITGCRMSNPAPATARKAQLRNNAAVVQLPPLPTACQ